MCAYLALQSPLIYHPADAMEDYEGGVALTLISVPPFMLELLQVEMPLLLIRKCK
jgi:hypothetical protein